MELIFVLHSNIKQVGFQVSQELYPESYLNRWESITVGNNEEIIV